MRILIGCEESQTVTKAFRALGHEAYSCDIQDCSGGHPEWHLKGDINNFKKYILYCDFFGCHPVCTYLANSGVRWLISETPKIGFVYNHNLKKYINPDRWHKMVEAALFFKEMYRLLSIVGKGYLENPVMHKYAIDIIGVKHNQIVHPYHFGHTTSKKTCLWIVGLPLLKHTHSIHKSKRTYEIHKMKPSADRGKLRSKTFPGISLAMANQWGISNSLF